VASLEILCGEQPDPSAPRSDLPVKTFLPAAERSISTPVQ